MTVNGEASGLSSAWVVPIVLAGLLIYTGLHNYLLFHTLAELFSITVAVMAAVVAWHTYPFSRNHYLMYLGCGYFWVGALDFFHTLTFKGMHIFPIEVANPATQFWISGRYLEAIVLFSAPFFLTRSLNRRAVFLGLGVLTAAVYLLVMNDLFPDAYREAEGLTPFKIISEYIIIALLLGASVLMWARRRLIDRTILLLLELSVGFTILSEVLFTLYIDVDGPPNMFGHITKLISFWFIYVAIVRTSLNEPFRLLARNASTYDAVPDPTIVVDGDGVVRQTNKAARDLAGLGEEEILGRHCHGIYHSSLTPVDECPVCRRIGEFEALRSLELELAEQGRWYQFSLAPLGAPGQPYGMVHMSRDITQRKGVEQSLREGEERLSRAQRIAHVGSWEWSVATGELLWSDEMYRIFGREAQSHALTYDAFLAHVHPEDREMVRACSDATLESETPYALEFRIVRPDGEVRHVYRDAQTERDARGRPSRVVGTLQDITDRKQAELALQDSEHKYRTIMENAGEGIATATSEGRFLEGNRRLLEMLGYTREEFTTLTVHDIHPPEDEGSLRNAFETMAAGGLSIVEHQVRRKDGHVFPVAVVGSRINYGGHSLFLGIFRDLTEQKRAEQALRQSEEQYRTLVENLPQGVFMKNGDGIYISCNRNYARDLGLGDGEIAGKTDYDFHPAELADKYVADDMRVFESGQRLQLEEPYHRDGERLIVHTVKTPVRDERGDVTGVLGIFWDVTEEKEAEEELRRSLAEKEVLLREVHHRVKNNMQVISSLLGLESRKMQDQAALALFKDAENRIRAMGLVHERLYRCTDLARIDCGHYLRDMVAQLFHAYPAGDRVDCRFDIGDVQLSVDSAIPFGLIVNELVSNALKHAFPGRRSGEIRIAVHWSGPGILELVVADNGVGIPEEVDTASTGTLGLRLVKQIAERQLQGTVSVQRHDGTQWTLLLKTAAPDSPKHSVSGG